ncbi:uncharacterized protein LOC143299554 [Babylonia areolata]|uniref:uncharacterized protein LOC143299554 n=1 Tax=Babylonia areolata TaxID=304850 RepID=UPI003FD2C966
MEFKRGDGTEVKLNDSASSPVADIGIVDTGRGSETASSCHTEERKDEGAVMMTDAMKMIVEITEEDDNDKSSAKCLANEEMMAAVSTLKALMDKAKDVRGKVSQNTKRLRDKGAEDASDLQLPPSSKAVIKAKKSGAKNRHSSEESENGDVDTSPNTREDNGSNDKSKFEPQLTEKTVTDISKTNTCSERKTNPFRPSTEISSQPSVEMETEYSSYNLGDIRTVAVSNSLEDENDSYRPADTSLSGSSTDSAEEMAPLDTSLPFSVSPESESVPVSEMSPPSASQADSCPSSQDTSSLPVPSPQPSASSSCIPDSSVESKRECASTVNEPEVCVSTHTSISDNPSTPVTAVGSSDMPETTTSPHSKLETPLNLPVASDSGVLTEKSACAVQVCSSSPEKEVTSTSLGDEERDSMSKEDVQTRYGVVQPMDTDCAHTGDGADGQISQETDKYFSATSSSEKVSRVSGGSPSLLQSSVPASHVESTVPGFHINDSASILQSSVSTSLVECSDSASLVESSVSTSLVESSVTASHVESSVSTSHVESSVTASHVESSVAASHVESSVTASHVESSVSASLVESSVTASHVESSVTASHVESSVAASHVESSVTASHVESSVSASHVESSVTASHVESGDSTSIPESCNSASIPEPMEEN